MNEVLGQSEEDKLLETLMVVNGSSITTTVSSDISSVNWVPLIFLDWNEMGLGCNEFYIVLGHFAKDAYFGCVNGI